MGAQRIDLENEPLKEIRTGNPAEWLLGMDVAKARELLGNIGCSLRIHTRQGVETILPKSEREPRPFRWNVDVDEVEIIRSIHGRG